MDSPFICFLILSIINVSTGVQRIYPSENPVPLGSTVTLFSRDVVSTGAWMFSNDIIVFIYPGGQIITDLWRDRITFNSTTSSLTIRSLRVEDSGLYTLQEVNSFRDQLTLSVQVPISNVTLSANATHLVEFNDTAVLRCSVLSGSSLSYTWLKGSSDITAGGAAQLSDGGATLTLARVRRSDQGPYRCNVSNGVSAELSQAVYLNISYGPSNTTMWLVPMRSTYITGSNITLRCSAESSPPAMIQWMFNGLYLNQFGSRLQLEGATVSKAGNYRCILHNTVTFRFSSESAMIRIVEPIVSVVVNHTGGPAIFHEPFILSCEVVGTVGSIQWWRNGRLIAADNRTAFSMNNETLTLIPEQSDSGDYQCQAFNSVGNMTSSPYTVEVNYGPMTPVIAGPSMALTGTFVSLNCSSDSHPPSLISWHFNSSMASTSDLVMGPLTTNMSGMYTCRAYNNITGNTSTASVMLTVLAPVMMATVKVLGAQPILNHIFSLTCETAGSVESIIWMYNSSHLYADSTRLFSMDNTTLTFDPVMTSDNGNYQCVASNPLSVYHSQVFPLEVFYGPQMPTITGPNAAKMGHSATFSCFASSNPPSSYEWFFNGSLVANTSEYITPPLTEDMSGMYSCMAYNNITGRNSTADTMLTVIDPIDFVQIEAPATPAIEGHFYQLRCNVTGPVVHVYWMKNGEPLHEDNRTVFSMDNKTVSFNPLERNDTGYYQCKAANAAWNVTSSLYMLFVNFGPETPVIQGPDFAEEGQYVVFQCSALSVPPSQFTWFFNGAEVANTSWFNTGILSLNMSGQYTCMAHNYVTGNTTSTSKMLTVINATESVIREDTVPINFKDFTLICDVTGPFDMIYWMKDGVRLNMTTSTSPDTSHHTGNSTLHFTPVTVSDDGTYHCVATNQAGPHESPPYTLRVNYGPVSVTISGPHSVGNTVSFTCSADSRPGCDFHWFFNSQFSIAVKTGPVITFSDTKENEGNYTCKARNPVTNITKYRTTAFTTARASVLHLPSHGGLMVLGLFALFVPVLFP